MNVGAEIRRRLAALDPVEVELVDESENHRGHAGYQTGGNTHWRLSIVSPRFAGQPVVARFAVKPTSSILAPRRTITRAAEETEIVTKGRHDPCVGIRAVPVGEAMVACVLADAFLRHRGQVGA